MKNTLSKLFVAAIMFSVITLSSMAEDNQIRVIKIFDTDLLVNTTNLSTAIGLDYFKPESFAYSVQLSSTNSVTNSGALTLKYEISNDGITYPISSNICANFSFTNSPNGDGQHIYFFTPGISRYLRLRAISSLTNINLKVFLAIQ